MHNIDDYLSVLFEHFEVNKFVHVDLVPATDEEWGFDDAEAYVSKLGESCGVHCFEIEYKESLMSDEIAFTTMLAHECVHIAQELSGMVMDYSLPYVEQEHEIEAYDMQEWLVFNSNMQRNMS